ncbi:class II aldolase/adducin family protein [Jiangella alba]|uniref:Class II Aldolase and Adducin N-terminal domain-containing protein n=1 Tax=Jiangella alba TaxID=561176 RepID=A0A1H5PZ59_9ACTN|nr:class II aldolase/adducin family protein [Jiangella alba]SEF18944.1 Class II Aldolase and Adducin N-terminal domain-containing protein [Jiangella alba]
MVSDADPVAELAGLCRALGDPAAGLVVAGEGNASGPGPDGTIHVTASGSRLAEADERSLVRIRPDALVAALDRDGSDEEWLTALLASRVDDTAARPTVEAGLHAVVAAAMGPVYVAHTHPVHVLALLCGERGAELATQRLYPDHVVMLGETACWLPYVDPGQELARAAGVELHRFRASTGRWPRLLFAGHHGVFAFGATPRQALDTTIMTEKIARITIAAASIGGVTPLAPSEVERIGSREDEAYRRRLLSTS